MHTYTNGKRKTKLEHKRKVQSHIKGFYSVLAELDLVAEKIRKSEVVITEDNIETEASKVMGREIDSMEKFLLLGKLNVGNEQENNIK